MQRGAQARRAVAKVGTSTLTHENGSIHFRRLETLCQVLSDLRGAGREILLVSSGAIAVGVGKLGLPRRPEETERKQALAAVGQCELMFLYDKFFGQFQQTVAQVLLTARDTRDPVSRAHMHGALEELFRMGIIPVVNENDTVAVDELVGDCFGDNDTLSATVAALVHADLLVLLTDIDGLYTADPRTHPGAKRIPYVPRVTDEIRALAGGAGSARGTGGMQTKLRAAEISAASGIPCCVASGEDPRVLYGLFEGEPAGTFFGATDEN